MCVESVLIHSSHALLRDRMVHGARMLQVGALLVPVAAVIVHVRGRRTLRRLRDLSSVDRGLGGAAVPHGRGGRRVTGHGVAGVWTVLQGNLAVLVQLLEL